MSKWADLPFHSQQLCLWLKLRFISLPAHSPFTDFSQCGYKLAQRRDFTHAASGRCNAHSQTNHHNVICCVVLAAGWRDEEEEEEENLAAEEKDGTEWLQACVSVCMWGVTQREFCGETADSCSDVYPTVVWNCTTVGFHPPASCPVLEAGEEEFHCHRQHRSKLIIRVLKEEELNEPIKGLFDIITAQRASILKLNMSANASVWSCLHMSHCCLLITSLAPAFRLGTDECAAGFHLRFSTSVNSFEVDGYSSLLHFILLRKNFQRRLVSLVMLWLLITQIHFKTNYMLIIYSRVFL